jgi:hypothetical protein
MKERLNLMDDIERAAWRRQQSKDPKQESVCARCGEELNPLALNSTYKGGFFVYWRKSHEEGGMHTSENCILLCNKCYRGLKGENDIKEIPLNMLPFFNG